MNNWNETIIVLLPQLEFIVTIREKKSHQASLIADAINLGIPKCTGKV